MSKRNAPILGLGVAAGALFGDNLFVLGAVILLLAVALSVWGQNSG